MPQRPLPFPPQNSIGDTNEARAPRLRSNAKKDRHNSHHHRKNDLRKLTIARSVSGHSTRGAFFPSKDKPPLPLNVTFPKSDIPRDLDQVTNDRDMATEEPYRNDLYQENGGLEDAPDHNLLSAHYNKRKISQYPPECMNRTENSKVYDAEYGYGSMMPSESNFVSEDNSTNNNESLKSRRKYVENMSVGNDHGTVDSMKNRLDSLYLLFVYDEKNPEFTTLQQSVWAVVIGSLIGALTAFWDKIIDFCIDFVWKTVPEALLDYGIFTKLDGPRPLPHYFWVCPAFFGGVLSYISAWYGDILTQDMWMDSLQKKGVTDASSILHYIAITTFGMASGLSLGPETLLVIAGGMIGSFFASRYNQSILSSRVLNLTAASAAVGGFFGFPMVGALFVLELPHRMGLQYFEALSPATLASILAVIVNQWILKRELEPKYTYPRRVTEYPNFMFWIALMYGGVGVVVGLSYVKVSKFLKKWVHDWFQSHHHCDESQEANEHEEIFYNHPTEQVETNDDHGTERIPLKEGCEQKSKTEFSGFKIFNRIIRIIISNEPKRAAAAGVLAGGTVGFICMFLPHCLFWGEAQLQNIIDQGETPLPVFGSGTDPTACMTAYSICNGDEGYSYACSGIIAAAKVIVIGLSLGTGIPGGHFWGPLYVGASSSHFFIHLWKILRKTIGLSNFLTPQPGVAMLCIMGSSHTLIFRAHIAIMLILVLTIRSFSDLKDVDDNTTDYLVIFPLMVVACFLSLICTKNGPVYYPAQRCRGDITAVQAVLCVPSDGGLTDDDNSLSDNSYSSDEESMSDTGVSGITPSASSNHSSARRSIPERGRSHRRSNSDPSSLTLTLTSTYKKSLLDQGRRRSSRSPSLKEENRRRSITNSRSAVSLLIENDEKGSYSTPYGLRDRANSSPVKMREMYFPR